MPEELMSVHRKGRSKTKAWYYIVAIALVLFYLLPVYVLLDQSFRTVQDMGAVLALPAKWNIQNYLDALKGSGLWVGFRNSIVSVAETVAIQIVVSALGAYGLARSAGWVSNAISSVNMAIMMIPGVALLVGTYSLMANLHMTNSIIGLSLLTAAGGIPGTMYMYCNFVAAIPKALDEAAEIDGAGVLRTFFQIILPQLKAVTVTQIIMAGTGCWNNYLMPMYLLQNKSKFTIILIIKTAFNSSNGVGNLPKACATCALGLLPVIVLYLFLQKYIIEGQIESSVK